MFVWRWVKRGHRFGLAALAKSVSWCAVPVPRLQIPSWLPCTELRSVARQVDLVLVQCRTDAEALRILNTDDRLEVSLRQLGACIYEQRAKDFEGVASRRGSSLRELVATYCHIWLMTEGASVPNNERQCSERALSKIRRQGQVVAGRRKCAMEGS